MELLVGVLMVGFVGLLLFITWLASRELPRKK